MKKLTVIIIIFFSNYTYANEFSVSCNPDTTLDGNTAGGSFSLLINDKETYVYKTWTDEYQYSFITFNNLKIVFEVASGDYAFIDRISGKYKIVKQPNSAFSDAVWQCKKIETAF